MDANQTLADFFAAVRDGDKEQAAELLHALEQWLLKGGFLPDLRKAYQALESVLDGAQ